MNGLENAHALVVGISRYRHVNPLPATVHKDAQDVYDLLIDDRHCGYLPENVALLLDEAATGAALRRELAALATRSDPDAVVFIYFSGHGGRIPAGPHAGEYLLPVDARPGTAQALAESALSGDAFTDALQAIPARKVVVVFDCCHAGGIGQPKDGGAPMLKTGLSHSYYDRLKSGRGRAVLASSRSSERSYVLPGAENSLFTQHLLAGLRGGVASADRFVRIFDLFEYLQPRVTGDHAGQHPVFKADLEENFAVALYRGGQKGTVPQAEDGFRYDAYVSYVHQEPDAAWVWQTLVPRLKAAGVSVAVSGAVEEPGVALIVGVERAIRQARRTVVVLSDGYVADNLAHFQNVLAQTIGVQERRARLCPVMIEPVDRDRLRAGLGMLFTLDLTDPYLAEHNFDRLVATLQAPLADG